MSTRCNREGAKDFTVNTLSLVAKRNIVGLGISGGWFLGDLLSRTETYNRLFFRLGSSVYIERGIKYGWYIPYQNPSNQQSDLKKNKTFFEHIKNNY